MRQLNLDGPTKKKGKLSGYRGPRGGHVCPHHGFITPVLVRSDAV